MLLQGLIIFVGCMYWLGVGALQCQSVTLNGNNSLVIGSENCSDDWQSCTIFYETTVTGELNSFDHKCNRHCVYNGEILFSMNVPGNTFQTCHVYKNKKNLIYIYCDCRTDGCNAINSELYQLLRTIVKATTEKDINSLIPYPPSVFEPEITVSSENLAIIASAKSGLNERKLQCQRVTISSDNTLVIGVQSTTDLSDSCVIDFRVIDDKEYIRTDFYHGANHTCIMKRHIKRIVTVEGDDSQRCYYFGAYYLGFYCECLSDNCNKLGGSLHKLLKTLVKEVTGKPMSNWIKPVAHKCGEDWVQNDGEQGIPTCYKLMQRDECIDFLEAKSICNRNDGYMSTVRDDSENNAILAAFKKVVTNTKVLTIAWLGAYDINFVPNQTEKRAPNYHWDVDNSTIGPYTRWIRGEPSQYTIVGNEYESCLSAWYGNGYQLQWNDSLCKRGELGQCGDKYDVKAVVCAKLGIEQVEYWDLISLLKYLFENEMVCSSRDQNYTLRHPRKVMNNDDDESNMTSNSMNIMCNGDDIRP